MSQKRTAISAGAEGIRKLKAAEQRKRVVETARSLFVERADLDQSQVSGQVFHLATAEKCVRAAIVFEHVAENYLTEKWEP